MASDPPDRRGLLPPDGEPWPPEPAPIGALEAGDWSMPTPPGRPADAAVDDWRSMPGDVPPGYAGSASAPPPPAARLETYSVVAFVCAIVSFVPLTWAVPVLPVLGLAFGLVGRRNCVLDPTFQGKLLATWAIVLSVVSGGVVAVLVAIGNQTIGA